MWVYVACVRHRCRVLDVVLETKILVCVTCSMQPMVHQHKAPLLYIRAPSARKPLANMSTAMLSTVAAAQMASVTLVPRTVSTLARRAYHVKSCCNEAIIVFMEGISLGPAVVHAATRRSPAECPVACHRHIDCAREVVGGMEF